MHVLLAHELTIQLISLVSTAYHMSRDVRFATSEIILLDTWDFEPDSKTISVQNPGAANADTSRSKC